MKIQIDISVHLRNKYEDSVLALSSTDQSFQKTIILTSAIKKQINSYMDNIPQIHSLMVIELLQDLPESVTEIQICIDVSKNKLHNLLQKKLPPILLSRISIKSVGKCPAHILANDVRKGKKAANLRLYKNTIDDYLRDL